MTTSLSDLTDQLAAAKRDRAVLVWLLREWKDLRMDGHASRRATVEGLGLSVPQLRSSPVTNFIDLETQLLFTDPVAFIAYVWQR